MFLNLPSFPLSWHTSPWLGGSDTNSIYKRLVTRTESIELYLNDQRTFTLSSGSPIIWVILNSSHNSHIPDSRFDVVDRTSKTVSDVKCLPVVV